MSLIQGRWIVPGAAAIAAVAIPLWLLRSPTAEAETPPPLVVTELAALPVGGLEQARSAPIFSPTRAPPDLNSAPAPSGGEGAAAAPAPMPALVGLVSRAGGRGVALVKASSGETVTLAPGESVDGWRLVGIGRDRATFASNGERRVAALDFSNKMREGTPASSATPPPIPLPPPSGLPAGSVRQPPMPAWPEPWLPDQSGKSR
jgi:hypothetical protein